MPSGELATWLQGYRDKMRCVPWTRQSRPRSERRPCAKLAANRLPRPRCREGQTAVLKSHSFNTSQRPNFTPTKTLGLILVISKSSFLVVRAEIGRRGRYPALTKMSSTTIDLSEIIEVYNKSAAFMHVRDRTSTPYKKPIKKRIHETRSLYLYF